MKKFVLSFGIVAFFLGFGVVEASQLYVSNIYADNSKKQIRTQICLPSGDGMAVDFRVKVNTTSGINNVENSFQAWFNGAECQDFTIGSFDVFGIKSSGSYSMNPILLVDGNFAGSISKEVSVVVSKAVSEKKPGLFLQGIENDTHNAKVLANICNNPGGGSFQGNIEWSMAALGKKTISENKYYQIQEGKCVSLGSGYNDYGIYKNGTYRFVGDFYFKGNANFSKHGSDTLSISSLAEQKPTTYIPVKTQPVEYEQEVQVAQNIFPDLTPGSLEKEAAIYLRQKGIIGGFPDGEFKGDKLVNRAEAAKFLLLAKGTNVGSLQNNNTFYDVLNDQWYTKYVMKAHQLGIINGYDDGSFGPGNHVNTAEFMKMFTKNFRLEEDLPYIYEDVFWEDWFTHYAGNARKYDLFPQRGDHLFHPGSSLTRSEVAIAIYQYLKATGQ